MVHKNFYIKNINIKLIIIYYNFYKQFYDKKLYMGYIIDLIYSLIKIKSYLVKNYNYYSYLIVKNHYKNQLYKNKLNYSFLKNKYKFVDTNIYCTMYKHYTTLNHGKLIYLYNFNISNNSPNYLTPESYKMSLHNLFKYTYTYFINKYVKLILLVKIYRHYNATLLLTIR